MRRTTNPSDRSKAFSVSSIFSSQGFPYGSAEGYREMGLPVVVLHCKVDLTKEDGSGVNPQEALVEFKKYDTGLIQVSTADPSLECKMGKSIDYVLKTIVLQRGKKFFTPRISSSLVNRFKPRRRE
jgi:hypothetical protein